MRYHIEQELDQIAQIVARFPEGAALSQIVACVQSGLPDYTVQRRLAELVEQDRIALKGSRRGARYFPVNVRLVAAESRPGPLGGNVVPLSSEAQRLRLEIRKPLGARTPVGYRHEFLDRYRPNQTFYLPEPLRDRLREISVVPIQARPAGTYARQIIQRLMIDLSWNSSRLEGNTYSLLETEKLLENGKSAEGRNPRETQMLLNHKDAIEFLVDGADEIAFDRYTILNLHALLARDLLSRSVGEGRLRTIRVGIHGTAYMPLEVPQLIDEYFTQILDTAQAIRDPFEQAFFAMVHLPYLQPFEDVNKRVSRLAANIPFIKKNLCPLSFVDLPEDDYVSGLLAVYEKNDVTLLRDVFAWAYERSAASYAAVRHTIGEPDPFRMKYRGEIFDTVAEVVRGNLGKSEAAKLIQLRAAERVESFDQARFVEIVETELIHLHIGNIARYKIRPSEFEAWQKAWR